jgi:hypothetical protein
MVEADEPVGGLIDRLEGRKKGKKRQAVDPRDRDELSLDEVWTLRDDD